MRTIIKKTPKCRNDKIRTAFKDFFLGHEIIKYFDNEKYEFSLGKLIPRSRFMSFLCGDIYERRGSYDIYADDDGKIVLFRFKSYDSDFTALCVEFEESLKFIVEIEVIEMFCDGE